MVLELPEQKMQLRKLITETLQNKQARQHSREAAANCQLIAMRPALELAKLYSRCLCEALQGETHTWDELHQFDGAWRADLQWLHRVLHPWQTHDQEGARNQASRGCWRNRIVCLQPRA